MQCQAPGAKGAPRQVSETVACVLPTWERRPPSALTGRGAEGLRRFTEEAHSRQMGITGIQHVETIRHSGHGVLAEASVLGCEQAGDRQVDGPRQNDNALGQPSLSLFAACRLRWMAPVWVVRVVITQRRGARSDTTVMMGRHSPGGLGAPAVRSPVSSSGSAVKGLRRLLRVADHYG
jgi:hypothetical protein